MSVWHAQDPAGRARLLIIRDREAEARQLAHEYLEVEPEVRAAQLADIPARAREWAPAGTPGLFVLDADREAGA
jgi:hypothetical protein